MKFDYTKFEDELEVLLAQDRIESWRLLTAGQYRINNFFDIYPKSKKYFNSATEERGEYQSLNELIVIR